MRSLLVLAVLVALSACHAKPRGYTSDGLPISEKANVTGDGRPVQ